MRRPILYPIVLVLAAAGLIGEPVESGSAPAFAVPQVTVECDPIDPAACLLPFPNDRFTVPDPDTATGRRVGLRPELMLRNLQNSPVDPAEWNRNDGFSPGSPVLAVVPGIDLARTGAAPITDIGASVRPDAPIVLLDADTGRRHPYFAELDARASDPGRRALIIRPAANLAEGHRYLVALRNLRDAAGAPIPAGPAFAAMLEDDPPEDPALRARWASLRGVLWQLRQAGVGNDGLYLAWDFTVASTENITGRAVHMRDEAFARLGDRPPAVTITEVTDLAPEQDPLVARQVVGRVEVPKYLVGSGGPGARLHYGRDGRPEPDGVYAAAFQCVVPRTAVATAARPLLHGHGLFGDYTSTGRLRALASEANVLPCGVTLLGMSAEDIGFLATVTRNLTAFPAVPDRMQQAYLNALFLSRAMIHPDGLAALPAFRAADGTPLLDHDAGLGFLGVSLGGIQGMAVTALAQDFSRAALLVPATNFSTMLNRASPFERFMPGFDYWYADRLDQQLAWALMQMLWDRGEGNGYAGHVTRDPLPGTPRHDVLLQMVLGDRQVANVATETTARTLGVHVLAPAGRSVDVQPYWGLPPAEPPFAGSALSVWDSEVPLPPPGNVVPTEGFDPHGDVILTVAARRQALHFLATGEVIDVCGRAPCETYAIP